MLKWPLPAKWLVLAKILYEAYCAHGWQQNKRLHGKRLLVSIADGINKITALLKQSRGAGLGIFIARAALTLFFQKWYWILFRV